MQAASVEVPLLFLFAAMSTIIIKILSDETQTFVKTIFLVEAVVTNFCGVRAGVLGRIVVVARGRGVHTGRLNEAGVANLNFVVDLVVFGVVVVMVVVEVVVVVVVVVVAINDVGVVVVVLVDVVVVVVEVVVVGFVVVVVVVFAVVGLFFGGFRDVFGVEGTVVMNVASVVKLALVDKTGFTVVNFGRETISTDSSSKISNPFNNSGSISPIKTVCPLPSSNTLSASSSLFSSERGSKKSSITSVFSFSSFFCLFLISLGHIGGVPCSSFFCRSLGQRGTDSSAFDVVDFTEVVVGSSVKNSVVLVGSTVVYLKIMLGN